MVKGNVIKIIADQININASEISIKFSLFDDLGLDGEEFLSVISILEDEYEIEFDDESLEEIESVSDLIRFVNDNI